MHILTPLLSLLTLPLLSTTHPTTRTPSNCTTGVHIIVARGTLELPGPGFTGLIAAAIVRAIPGSDMVSVDYPADLNLPVSLAAGVADLKSKAASYAASCPASRLVLMGYSQGAQVVGDALAGGGTPTPFGMPSPPADPLEESVAERIVAVIQFGDPNRVIGQGEDAFVAKCTVDSLTSRSGLNRERFEAFKERTQEWCNAEDPVCCSTGANFLAHLSYFDPYTASKAAEFVKARLGA